MRILDRYLLREFLLPLLYCLDAFVLLWLVMDLFGRLDDFIEYHARLGQAAQYYLIVFPQALVQIVPMALLLGLLFGLARLGKHNELLAMRAGGVSLARIALPLLGIGLAVSLVMLVINDRFVPGAKEKAHTYLEVLRGRAAPDAVSNLFFTNTRENRDWYVVRFHVRERELEFPEVHERLPDGSPRRDIYAARARWENDQWMFYDVDVYDHTRGINPPPVQRFSQMVFPQLDERPQRLLTENKKPAEMTSGELRRTIRALERAGHGARTAELRATMHHRYAFPFASLVVIWLGLPLGLSVRRSGALLSVGTALILIVTYYITTEFALKFASGGLLPAALAAWLTNITFGIVGAVLMWRAR